MMALVVHKFQEFGVEVKHIPGGCTFLCQPVDVMFDKPFKSCIQKMWIRWLINKGINQHTTSLPMRLNIPMWVNEAMGHMEDEQRIIRNGWLKMGFN
jgi:hypothetical protein